MEYASVLEYLYSRLPMYQRIGAAAYKENLDNTLAFCKALNNPQNRFKTIHIAGTNGKGSTSHALASIFQENGYKTGLYTSPHLLDFRERIRINGEMISEKSVIQFVAENQNNIEEISPSFFETTVAMAFDYFYKNAVEIAIIETGLGGRLDSTNVIVPELSIITNIGIDHTEFLGHTRQKIAVEKAGIIKKRIPVILGESDPEIQNVFIETALRNESELFIVENFNNLSSEIKSDLKGAFQQKNLRTVLKAVDVLNSNGFNLNLQSVHNGLQNVCRNTGLRGRWETLSLNPIIIADTGHNKDGLQVAMEELVKINCKELYMVFGVVKEKESQNIWPLLPKKAHYYFCKASIPRAREAENLNEEAKRNGIFGKCFNSVDDALKQAISVATSDDAIFIGGSNFVVADALQFLEANAI